MSSETPAEHLARLKVTYPAWTLWKDSQGEGYWGMPPQGHRRQHLVEAKDLPQLEARLAEAEGR